MLGWFAASWPLRSFNVGLVLRLVRVWVGVDFGHDIGVGSGFGSSLLGFGRGPQRIQFCYISPIDNTYWPLKPATVGGWMLWVWNAFGLLGLLSVVALSCCATSASSQEGWRWQTPQVLGKMRREKQKKWKASTHIFSRAVSSKCIHYIVKYPIYRAINFLHAALSVASCKITLKRCTSSSIRVIWKSTSWPCREATHYSSSSDTAVPAGTLQQYLTGSSSLAGGIRGLWVDVGFGDGFGI